MIKGNNMNWVDKINRLMLKEGNPVNGFRNYSIRWWAKPIIKLRIKIRRRKLT